MIKRTALIWSATGMLLTLIFSSPVVGAQRYDVHELIELSGIDNQLNTLPDAVNESFEYIMETEGVIDPFEIQDIPLLQDAVASVFQTDALRNSLLTEMRQTLSTTDLETLIRFYSSDTGVALRESELTNSMLKHPERFQRWYDNTGLYALNHERRLAIEDLEWSMKATVGAVEAMIGMQVALQVSLSPALPVEQRLSPREFLMIAQEQRDELTNAYLESSLAGLAFIYQDQSIDAIRAYSAILKTDAGQRFVKATNRGLTRGLFHAAEQLGVSVNAILVGRTGLGA